MEYFASESWKARDLNAVLHGFTDFGTLNDKGPLVISHGDGIYVYDVDGKRYIEGNSGLWNVVAGFKHPGLEEVAHRQIDRFPAYHAFFGRVTEPAVELAEKLLEIAPVPMSKVFFTNSGSEANDSVVKMLWMINRGLGKPEKRKIITRKGGYHGVTAVSASMTGKDYNDAFGLPLEGFIHTDCPHHWRYAELGEDEVAFSARLAKNLANLIESEGAETIAGFFAEPVLGAGGVIPPPEGYFEAIQPILRRYGIPFIADEVITGFGRSGNLWGCQTYAMEPDILVASKCLTAGYFPMAAILVSEKIYEALLGASDEFDEFPHGFTSGGHPVGCAIGVKAIDVITNEGVLDNLMQVSPRFLSGLQSFASRPYIGEVRGVGLMGALELVSDRDSKAPFPSEAMVSERIANQALENNLICRPIGQSIVLAPPFIINEPELDDLFESLDKTLSEVLD